MCPRPDPDAPVDATGMLPLELVRRVAQLARLELDEAQVRRLAGELGAVVGHFEQIRRADLADVEPLIHAGEGVNRLDDDAVGPVLETHRLASMAPQSEGPFVRVPKVLGGGSA